MRKLFAVKFYKTELILSIDNYFDNSIIYMEEILIKRINMSYFIIRRLVNGSIIGIDIMTDSQISFCFNDPNNKIGFQIENEINTDIDILHSIKRWLIDIVEEKGYLNESDKN